MRLSTWLRMELASAMAVLVTPRARLVASTTRPMLDIADSAVCYASCAQCCATDNPTGGNVGRGPGETEREQDSTPPLANAEIGALYEIVTELPGIYPMRGADDGVSSTVVPTTCWELLRNKSC